MLLRQLHRPLLRPVTQAWRPAAVFPALYRHGDSRANSDISNSNSNSNSNIASETSTSASEASSSEASSSEASSSETNGSTSSIINGLQLQHEEDQQQAPPDPAPSDPSPSLFERLFPDKVKQEKSTPRKSSIRMPEDFGLFGEEPPDLALLESLSNNEVSTKELSELYPTAFEAKAMLVLSAASKSLLESDFLRLGAKGKHLEGWIGGILKVVQARDPDTLEAKGHYFILFDSHEAALIYKERLEYLWQIGKAYVPGAHHKHSHMIQWSLPARLHQSAQGEDIAELVRAFTLIPPSQRHNIALSRVSPEKIAELYVDGGFVEQLANRIGSPFQVLIRLEGGRLTVDTLRHAIEEDGIQRNLPWRISDLENGILPFGKAFTKDKEESDTKKQKKKSNKKKEQTGESPNDPTKIIDNVIYETFEKQEKWYPRFVIPFMDKAEAYRFVRSWHRRELRVQMGGGGKKQPAWEDVRVINASVMW